MELNSVRRHSGLPREVFSSNFRSHLASPRWRTSAPTDRIGALAVCGGFSEKATALRLEQRH